MIGESIFDEWQQRAVVSGWKPLRSGRREVHPGADSLKTVLGRGIRVTHVTRFKLKDAMTSLSRVEPRINSSLRERIGPLSFVSEERKQAAAQQAFVFTRAYTKQMHKSRSDDSAQQRAFVSGKSACGGLTWA